MMNKELQDRLRRLQLKLNTLDIYAKNAVCDELLSILKEQGDQCCAPALCEGSAEVVCFIDGEVRAVLRDEGAEASGESTDIWRKRI